MKHELAANHTTIDEHASLPSPDESTWDQEPVPVAPLPELPSASDLPADDRNPVDVLADEFAARLRAGQTPSMDEYVSRAPEHEAAIRAIFPSVALLEGASQKRQQLDQNERRVQRLLLSENESLGDFRIVREIGRGGMGIVYEAEQQSLNRRVALKVLHPNVAMSERQQLRFQREAESAARLHHTNIVPVFAIGEEHGFHFYAMQFIDGATLSAAVEGSRSRTNPVLSDAETEATVIDAARVASEFSDGRSQISNFKSQIPDGNLQPDSRSECLAPLAPLGRVAGGEGQSHAGPSWQSPLTTDPSLQNAAAPSELTPHRTAQIGVQVAQALGYAHQHGMLHRDIKPANLMLDRDGNVWVTDFGLVKLADVDDLTGTGDLVGTVRYMAPEQLEGHSDVRTDLYSLGLTLFELCTLRPAFEGDQRSTLSQRLRHQTVPRPRAVNPDIPRDLETIIVKATAPEPAARYQSATELADDLQRFLDDRPILARRETLLGRAWRWSRRNPALASVTTFAIAALVAVAVVEWSGRLRVEAALRDTNIERRRAEASVELAVDAFDSILDNVTSRGVPLSLALNVPQVELGVSRSSLSEADAVLLDRLLGFYRRFADENSGNVRLSERIAAADFRAGTILVRLGQLTEAESHFARALTTLGTLREKQPQNIKLLVTTAQIHNEVGQLRLRRGDFFATMESHLEALAVFLDQPEAVLSDPSVRFERARATDFYATIDVRSGTDQGPGAAPRDGHDFGGPDQDGPERGPRHDDRRDAGHRPGPPPGSRPGGFDGREPPPFDNDRPPPPPDGNGPPHGEAHPGQSRSVDTAERRRSRAIPEPMRQAGGKSLRGLDAVLLEAAEEFRRLVVEFPDNAQYQFALAQCLRHRLVLAAGRDDAELARTTFLEAVSVLERLTQKSPDDPSFVFELTDTLTQAARAQSVVDAKASLQRAVETAEQLVSRFPNVPEYQLLLGTALARRASNQQANGFADDALLSLDRSIALMAALGERSPDQATIQIPLAKTRQQLGDLLRVTPDKATSAPRLAESLKVLERAVSDFDNFVARSQSNSQFVRATRSALSRSLAETLTPLNRPEEAAARRNAE